MIILLQAMNLQGSLRIAFSQSDLNGLMRGSRKNVRGGPTFFSTLAIFLIFFKLMRGERGTKYHYKWAFIDPPAKRLLNGVSLACR